MLTVYDSGQMSFVSNSIFLYSYLQVGYIDFPDREYFPTAITDVTKLLTIIYEHDNSYVKILNYVLALR